VDITFIRWLYIRFLRLVNCYTILNSCIYFHHLRLESLERNLERASGHIVAIPVALQLQEQVRNLLVEARQIAQPQGPSEYLLVL
jgi:hypothetical protein